MSNAATAPVSGAVTVDRAGCVELDRQDELRHFRSRFDLSDDVICLDGACRAWQSDLTETSTGLADHAGL